MRKMGFLEVPIYELDIFQDLRYYRLNYQNRQQYRRVLCNILSIP